MGKQSNNNAIVKLIIWVMIMTGFLYVVTKIFTVPNNRESSHEERVDSRHTWNDEPNFIAAWDRDLTQAEIELLIIGSRTGFYGGMNKFYHLLHHGDEPLVIEELQNTANSSDLLNVAICEFALFKLRDNPEERLQHAMEIAVTGGLDYEKLTYFSTGYEGFPDHLKEELSSASTVIRKSTFLFSNFIDPTEDIEYLPIIMEPFKKDYIHMIWLIEIIGPFQGNAEVDEIVQGYQNENIRLPGMGETPFDEFIDQRFDTAAYDEKIQQNLI